MSASAPASKLCSRCGAPLPGDAPAGVCPRCELQGALALLPGAAGTGADIDRGATGSTPLEPCRFGNYELLEEIARGGMGVVYRARQVNLDRIVAVKMILSGQFATKQFVQRFRAEASAAAVLQHPNIVAVHDVGAEEGQHYFSMDFVEGQNLAQLVGQRPLSPAKAARYVKLIAEAIHYAHGQAILHRDLKPSNVLVDAHDQPRVTDFGLAKRLDGESSLTVTGQVLGSPNFMPPEQASSERGKVGRPSDVYGLGAILYFLLTARAPFQAESFEAIVTQVLNAEPISPRLLNPAMPQDLETICFKCLEKEPARRYQAAQELAEELDRFLRDEPIRARPVSPTEKAWRWCRRNPKVAGLGATAALLFFFGFAGVSWQWQRAQHNAEESRVRLVRSHVQRGTSLAETGDMTGALLLFAEALRLDQNDAARTEMHRFRLGAAMSRCPKLLQLFVHDGKLNWAEFSADGRKIVTASGDTTARVWDASTGEPLSPPLRHRGEVTTAAFSPDGRRVVTASADKTAGIWDASSGAQLTPPLGHQQLVTFAAFSPDGLRVATASADRSARIWNTVTGEPLTPPLEHIGTVGWALFSPDGQWIVTASGDFLDRKKGEAVVWDAASGSVIARVRHDAQVWSVAFSPDGRWIVTSSVDKTGRVWDAATGQELLRLQHDEGLQSAAFSPDGRCVVTACEDKTARVWDALTGELIATVRHGNWVMPAFFSPDGRWIATASWDKTSRVWDAATGQPITALLQHIGLVWFVTFSPDSRCVLTASGDKTARLWDVGRSPEFPRFALDPSGVKSAAFSPNGRLIVTIEQGGKVSLWDANSGKLLFAAPEYSGKVLDVAFNRDGRRMITGSDDQMAHVWDVANGKILCTIRHNWHVTRVAFSPDDRRVVTASGGAIRLSNALTGESVAPPWDVNSPVTSIHFSPDGRRFVMSTGTQLTGGEAEARVWDADTAQPITPPLKHAARILVAWFSSDGRRILTASDDQTARLWDAATGQELTPPLKHNGELRHASFSPDGSRVVTTSFDTTAQVWDAATGQPIAPPLAHQKGVYHAAFSPDGRRIATGSDDQTVRVWDASTGEPVAPPLPHPARIDCLAFSRDGRRVLTVSGGRAWLWDLPKEERPAGDLVLLAQVLSGRHIVRPGDMVPLSAPELTRAWRALRSKYPGEFSVPPAEILAWHQRQAEECEQGAQWFAARFHLDRLLATRPDDESLRLRRAAVQEQLSQQER